MAEDKNGPKDTTPSPLDEVTKGAEAQAPAEAAKEAPPAEGAQKKEEAAPPPDPEEKSPENVKALMKESFFDSLGWNRIAQIILVAAGIYGLLLGVTLALT